MKQIMVGKVKDKNLIMEVQPNCVEILYGDNSFPLHTFGFVDRFIEEHKQIPFKELVTALFDDEIIKITLERMLAYDVKYGVIKLVGDDSFYENMGNTKHQLLYIYFCDCALMAMLEFIREKQMYG